MRRNLLTLDATKTLAKIIYELRAGEKSLQSIRGVFPETKMLQEMLRRHVSSLELMVNQMVSQTGDQLTQGERDQIWMLIREGKSQLG